MKLKLIAMSMALLLTAGCLSACLGNNPEGDFDSLADEEPNHSDSSADSTDESLIDSDTSGDSTDEGESEDESAGEDNYEEEERLIPTRYTLTNKTEGVKLLGVRNLDSESSLHMDWTCSGIEFAIDLKGGSVRCNFIVSGNCYFRVWVDGVEYVQNGSPYITVTTANGMITLNGISAGKHTIRIVKVTGYTLARAELTSVTLAGTVLTDMVDTSDKELYIEFVGDSITCGWGTIGNHQGAYTDQDGTYAYSYLLAQELNADYSMTALSGQGLLCGTPGVAQGYNYASPVKDSENEYDFARKADIVVINIGTNDYSKNVGENEFKAAYLEFLRTVREKNGESCKILCLYNTMNDTYANAIIAACEEFGGELAGVKTYKLDRAENNAHPNISEHAAYAEKLKDIILNLPEIFVPTLTVIPNGDGDLDGMDWNLN